MAYKYPFPIDKLTTPAFCVDRNRITRNCEKMLKTAQEYGVELRPHMKTHKTIEGGILMTGGTRRRIVVSTLAEAEYYADAGFDDILYGYPLTVEKIPSNLAHTTHQATAGLTSDSREEICVALEQRMRRHAYKARCLDLANRLEQFHVLTDNEITIDALAQCRNQKGWSVFLKVDCGNNRAGVYWENIPLGVSLAKKVVDSKNLRFAGFYVHCGDSYKAGADGTTKVTDVGKRTISRLHAFAKGVEEQSGIKCPRFAIGSTPSCSQPISEMRVVSELHPGNYVFYDAQQYTLGSCGLDDIACAVATRVIGHYPHRNELLIDCGFAALTKQGLGQLPSGCVIFQDEDNLKLVDMTQEIGKVTTINGERLYWQRHPVGSMLFMYPWHSCATAALHPLYYIKDGNEIVDAWRPCRGW